MFGTRCFFCAVMDCRETGERGLLGTIIISPRPFVRRAGLTFALGVLVAGCSGGAATPPGAGMGGAGGSGAVGAAGSGGGGAGDIGAGGAVAEGGAGGASAGGGGAGGQGGSGTTSIETCTGVVPTGIGVPAGTVVTVSGVEDTNLATNAIDGDLENEWSPGAVTGWITLTFPTPVMIGAVRLHADALPPSNEIFTLSTSTSTTPLASLTAQVVMVPGTLLPEIRVPPGLYSDLTITVNAGASWVGINEIWLLPAPTCP